MDKILVLDPGNSTGWLFRNNEGEFTGGTIVENHKEVANLIYKYKPDILIYETFQLYPNKAQKMCWNSFYPVEVIGVIKYVAGLLNIKLIGLQPSVKKFSLAVDWSIIHSDEKITEHTKDTLRLYDYWHRNYEKLLD